MRPLLLTTALAAFGVSTLMLLGISRAAAADPPVATPLTPQIISDTSTGSPARLSLRDRLRSWFARDESSSSGTTYSPSGSTYRGYSTTPTASGTGRYYYSPYGGYTGPTGPTKEPPVSIPSNGH